MPYNGTGTFIPDPVNFPAVPDTTIQAAKFNSLIADIASGLSATLTRDGQGAASADISMGGFKITNLGTPGTAGDAVSLSYADSRYLLKDGGTGGTVSFGALTASSFACSTLTSNANWSLRVNNQDRMIVYADAGVTEMRVPYLTVTGNGTPGLQLHRTGSRAILQYIDTTGSYRVCDTNGAGTTGIGTFRLNILPEGSVWVGPSGRSTGNAATLGVVGEAPTVELSDGIANFGSYFRATPFPSTLTIGSVFGSDYNPKAIFDHLNLYFAPFYDGNLDLGVASRRWNRVFSVIGTIQTSDSRYKSNIRDLTFGLDFVKSLRPVSYQWKADTSVTHFGLVAQEVENLLSPLEYGMVQAGEIKGMNYSELIAPLVKAVQQLATKVEELEEQLRK